VSAFVWVCVGGDGYRIIIAIGTMIRNMGVFGEVNTHLSKDTSIRGSRVARTSIADATPARRSWKIPKII